VPLVSMRQDHGNSPETCRNVIEVGFTSVMMDGSLTEDGKTLADFEYNVRVTREVVEMAHERGVTVEGELGTLAVADVLSAAASQSRGCEEFANVLP